jgi:hypothetical protein
MRCAKALSPFATGLAVMILAAEAFADPEEDAKEAPRRPRTSQVLFRADTPRDESGNWIDHLSIRKGVGLVYHYKIEADDDRKIVLSVGGPALKKKRLGLMFEVRF